MTATTFSSVAEAEARRDELVEEIEVIDIQLGDRNRCDENGARLSEADFRRWRASALVARRHKTHELRMAKTWLNRQNEALTQQILDVLTEQTALLTRVATTLDALLEYAKEPE